MPKNKKSKAARATPSASQPKPPPPPPSTPRVTVDLTADTSTESVSQGLATRFKTNLSTIQDIFFDEARSTASFADRLNNCRKEMESQIEEMQEKGEDIGYPLSNAVTALEELGKLQSNLWDLAKKHADAGKLLCDMLGMPETVMVREQGEDGEHMED